MGQFETGFKNLDKQLLLDNDDLWVIGGMPSMGKSNFVLNMMLQNEDKHGLYLSLADNKFRTKKKIDDIKKVLSEDEELEYQYEWKNFTFKCIELPSLLEIIELITSQKDDYDYFVIDDLHSFRENFKPIFSKKKDYQDLMRYLKCLAVLIQKPIILLSETSYNVSNKAQKITGDDLYSITDYGLIHMFHGFREKYIDNITILFREDFSGISNKNQGSCYLITVKAKRKSQRDPIYVRFSYKNNFFKEEVYNYFGL